jgi:UDP-2-acetamido-2-deoxy-ribo-hexuluronate aminotransferase
MNLLIDNNVVIDYYDEIRSKKYPESVEVIEKLSKIYNLFISSSSLDNLEFVKKKKLKEKFGYVDKRILKRYMEDILSKFKIAKTPSYIDIDFDDIEDSQIIASAEAIDALVVTRDEKLLQKYSDITISPKDFLKINNQKPKSNIDFANLKKQYFKYYSKIEKEMDKVLNSAKYIMGDQIQELEKKLCEFTGAKEAITCGSGTDALLLAMMALDIKPGDEVITTPFTFIATAETIALLCAKPVFIDIDEETYNIDVTKIEEKITPKTKAIIAVSLYGQPCELDQLNQLTNNQYTNTPIYLIVDGAQSFGATYKGKAEVHYCDIYTTSFFPAKPLGCFGDGGAVLTNNEQLARKMKMLRVHGQNKRYHHKCIGLNARMDAIQAAIVNAKLKFYKEDFEKRNKVANKYSELLKNTNIILPIIKSDRTTPWAQYSIRVKCREKLQDYLSSPIATNQYTNISSTNTPMASIPTAVHYPMPLHLQECFKYLGYKEGDFPVAETISKEILSLPMNPYIDDYEIKYICSKVLECVNDGCKNFHFHSRGVCTGE